MLTGMVIYESAWEELNLRAPVYQTGAWTSSATGGSKDRVFIQPDPLRDQVGPGSNRRLGGHSPALYPAELRTWNWGSWSVPTRRPPAYEAGALPD
jgi:hypothetical protein